MAKLPSTPIITVLTGLATLFPTWIPSFMPNSVTPDKIWKNENVMKEFTSARRGEMSLNGGGRALCLGTALALVRTLQNVREEAIPGLSVPYFVAHGSHDFGVPLAGTEYLVEHSTTPEEDRSVRIIDGGYHCLLSEDDREDTAGALIDWMNSRV